MVAKGNFGKYIFCGMSFFWTSAAVPSAPPAQVLGDGGDICCRNCNAKRRYSERVCACGADPWTGQSIEALESCSSEASYASLADDHAECPICFEPLCKAQTAVFRDFAGKRVCIHFFHRDCAEQCARSHRDCPMCRATFADVLPVPDIDGDPIAWYRVCDKDGDGSLNIREVLSILKAQFPVDAAKLERDLPGLWRNWDPSMDGLIQQSEFLEPGGLLAFVRKNFGRAGAAGEVPDIRTDKQAWFDYVDEDKSGELSQAEVVRGLIKSFKLGTKFAQVSELKEQVAALWFLFDRDGSGEVHQEEFMQPNEGMADTLIASYQYHRS